METNKLNGPCERPGRALLFFVQTEILRRIPLDLIDAAIDEIALNRAARERSKVMASTYTQIVAKHLVDLATLEKEID